MKIGCCIPWGSFMPQESGEKPDAAVIFTKASEMILSAGFDAVECTCGLIMDLTEEQLRACAGKIPLVSCNSFIPGVGTVMAGGESLKKYVREVMRRLRIMGTNVVVFGSGRARDIPADMPREEGWKRIREFLMMCDEAGEEFGVTVLLEPLNSRESNVLNLVSEATELAKEMKLPHVAVLADAYHMMMENEPFCHAAEAGTLLKHVHVSEADRAMPGKTDKLKEFADMLRGCGYEGCVSVEAVPRDFMAELASCGRFMKEVFG